MQGIYVEVPVTIGCCGCEAERSVAWKVPVKAFCSAHGLKSVTARLLVADAAEEAGWLVRGTAALCPECLAAALDGEAPLSRPGSLIEGADLVVLAAAVRKMRRRADAE